VPPEERAIRTPGSNPLIVALDVPDLDQAIGLARRLEGEVGYYKVGLELFGASGPQGVREISRFGPVFLDLKLHDIPTTVERAARVLGELGVGMLTVHASGAAAMVAAAVEGLADGAQGSGHPTPLLLAVTVLTSLSDEELASTNSPPASEQVTALAQLAIGAGAQGLVCAPRDLDLLRGSLGEQPVLVVPGIRPVGAGTDDHARAAAPKTAIQAGADYLVVGRPIVRAADPVTAARSILSELDGR